MVVVALLVKLTSRARFYHKERVGLNGRTFPVHKFRSMRQAAEARPGRCGAGGTVRA
jgi:lipopolysaccharide/colanic/teichoic acid biosynthesis glycosyltransferase